MSSVHQLRRRLRERRALAPARARAGRPGRQRGRCRAPDREAAGRRTAGARAGPPARAWAPRVSSHRTRVAAQQERRDRDVGVPQRRADHGAGDLRKPAADPRRGVSSAQRHGSPHAEVAPEPRLWIRSGPVTASPARGSTAVSLESRCDRACRSPRPRSCPPGAPATVHPDIARDAAWSRAASGRSLAPAAARLPGPTCRHASTPRTATH